MEQEFDNLPDWKLKASNLGLRLITEEGDMEDPYTHYYAVDDHGYRGYFGDAQGQGADADHGIICDSEDELHNWGVLIPTRPQHSDLFTISANEPTPALVHVYIRENEHGEFEVPTSRNVGVCIYGNDVYFTDDREDAHDTAVATFGKHINVIFQEGTYSE